MNQEELDALAVRYGRVCDLFELFHEDPCSDPNEDYDIMVTSPEARRFALVVEELYAGFYMDDLD